MMEHRYLGSQRRRKNLIESYRIIYGKKARIPEDLYPGSRKGYDEQLAQIEHRDDFSVSIDIPSWIPDDKAPEYHRALDERIKKCIKDITEDAAAKYGKERPLTNVL